MGAIAQMERQRGLIESLTQSPSLRFAAQARAREQLFQAFPTSLAFEGFAGCTKEIQNRLLEAVGRPAAFEAFTSQLKQQSDQIMGAMGMSNTLAAIAAPSQQWRDEVLKNFGASSVLDSFKAQQRERYQGMFASIGSSAAMEQAFKHWSVSLTPGLADQMMAFQAGLLADIATVGADELVDDDEDRVWFGADSWSRLHFQMVAILKCAELMTTGMFAAKEELEAPFPGAVLYLLCMFIAAGELAAHFAKDALADDGD